MNTLRAASCFLVLTMVGCASTVPNELSRARSAYDQASQGPARDTNPAGLHTARQALNAAEQSFADHGDSDETKDLAYAAERKAAQAEVQAREYLNTQSRDRTLAQMQADEKAQVKLTSAELKRTRGELNAQQQETANERARRMEAEQRASQALAALGAVKQDTRGMVITLSGSVLFATNKSELLPAAKERLAEVANALTQQDPQAKIVVEGHTDSQGNAAYNQDLSQRRAESVRSFLVEKGVASDRISAQGFGLSRPIADNASAEGRANNRRVEIVVQNANSATNVR